jgi:NTP pyrophosphatase (non-canonical NTP hydrolase)
MNFNEYQNEALSFRLATADEAYVMFGLVGEVGELYGHVAKVIRDGLEADREYVKKELGDILWFVSQLAYDAGLSFEDVAAANIQKLASRAQRGTISGSGDDR